MSILSTAAMAAAPQAAPQEPQHASSALQVIVVRHAEKAEAGPHAADTVDARDPRLSDAGRARATELANILRDAGISAVYASQYRRTQETASAAAAAAGLQVLVRPASAEAGDAQAFARALREQHAGSVVLVVGHSNTVPVLVDALLGRQGAAGTLEESHYDRLFVVTQPAGGRPRLVLARYGQPTP